MKGKKPKIKISEVRIEKLNKEHNLNNFKSYEQDLVDFLHDDALRNQNQKISVTYLWFYQNQLVSYLTILTDSISLSASLKRYFRIEERIPYSSLPAIKIGRMCVDDDFLGRGLGTLMIEFTIQHAVKIGKNMGCRFLNLDAKRNLIKSRDSIHFYKKLDFKILRKRKKGTTAMYLDLVNPQH